MSLPESLSLTGRVAVVTGGSRGIGRAIALELASRGANVLVNYHSAAEAAQAVVAEIEAGGGRALAVKAATELKLTTGISSMVDTEVELTQPPPTAGQ